MHSVALDKAYHMICSDQSSGRGKLHSYSRDTLHEGVTAAPIVMHHSLVGMPLAIIS